MAGEVLEAKRALRKWGRARRLALDPGYRGRAQRDIAARCLEYVRESGAGTAAIYLAVHGEADLAGFIGAFERGGCGVLALPSTERADRLLFRRWSSSDATVARGPVLREPKPDAEELDPDLIFLPIVAFDGKLNRLGYGQGWYDRTLAHLAGTGTLAVGVAFADQYREAIPAEAHDRPMDACITEKKVWKRDIGR